MKPILLAAALTATLAAAACAGQPPGAPSPAVGAQAAAGVNATASASGSSCFRMTQIRGHRIAGDNTIYMRVGSDDVYQVTTAGACGAGALRNDTLIISTTAGADLICRPIDLDLKIRSGAGMVTPCIVSSIARLSAEQAKAIPEKLRP